MTIDSEEMRARFDEEVTRLKTWLDQGHSITRSDALFLVDYITVLRRKPGEPTFLYEYLASRAANQPIVSSAGGDLKMRTGEPLAVQADKAFGGDTKNGLELDVDPIGDNNRDVEAARSSRRPADPGSLNHTFVRTDEEIVARIGDIQKNDFFGFETMDLVATLPWELAKSYLHSGKGEVRTSAEWKPSPRDRKGVIEQMREYMIFALDKAENHRGLSANRSLNHFQAWLFLLGDDSLLAFAEDDGNYKNYAMPILKAICDKYQFAFPAQQWALNMASGKQCEYGCNEGCG